MVNNKKKYMIILGVLMFFPLRFFADNSGVTSSSDCVASGGTVTKKMGIGYSYQNVTCVNTITGDSKWEKHATTYCSGNGYEPVASTTRVWFDYGSGDKPDYVGAVVGDDYVCCEYNNSCKVGSDGKYYGASGSEVSYAQYSKECLKPKPAPVPEPEAPEQCIEKDGPTPSGCSIKETEANLNCSGEIKETELCGVIASGDDNYKTFGNDYCDIYCRRELILTFQEKAEVLAGRYFIHNVSKSQIDNLSGVITAKYECGGQIKYNTWKKDWKEANETLIETWNEYSYWNTVVNLAPLEITSGTYTCNSCSSTTCDTFCLCNSSECEAGSYLVCGSTEVPGGPFNSATLYDYKSKATPSTKAECKNNCEFTEGTCTNPTSSVGYSSLHNYYYHCGCSSGYACTLKSGDDPRPKLAAAASAYQAALTRVNKLKQDIKDCNNESLFFEDATIGRDVAACGGDGTTTGGYDENTIYHEGYEVNIADAQTGGSGISKTCNESSYFNSFCTGCDGDFVSTGCQTETLVYYVCTGTPGQGECHNETFTAPKNGAIYAYKTDLSTHWQSAKHYNQLFTGNITNSKVDDSYMELPDNAWPVGINRKTGTYDICYDINLDDPKGRMNGNSTTCEYLVINELQNYDCDDPNDPNGYHEKDCYDCGSDPTCKDDKTNGGDDGRNDDSMGVFFRAVDLSNLFPNSVYDKNLINSISATRIVGFNWKDQESVVEEIQRKGDEVWSNAEAELTVTLTPTAIRSIKQYNKESIINDTLDRTTGIKCSVQTLNCTSTFLKSELGSMIGTDNIVFNNELFEMNRYTLKESE